MVSTSVCPWSSFGRANTASPFPASNCIADLSSVLATWWCSWTESSVWWFEACVCDEQVVGFPESHERISCFIVSPLVQCKETEENNKFSEDIWFCFISYFCILLTYNSSIASLSEVLPHHSAIPDGLAQHTTAEAVWMLRQSTLALEAKSHTQCCAQKRSPLTLLDWSTKGYAPSVHPSICLPDMFKGVS